MGLYPASKKVLGSHAPSRRETFRMTTKYYFRAPRCGFFNLDCRSLGRFRLGLLMMKVPLPWASAEYCFSSTIKVHCLMKRLFSFIASLIAALIAAGVLLMAAPAQEVFTHIG